MSRRKEDAARETVNLATQGSGFIHQELSAFIDGLMSRLERRIVEREKRAKQAARRSSKRKSKRKLSR